MKKLLLAGAAAILSLLLLCAGAFAGDALPEAYDLRNVGGSSFLGASVRDQGRTGACWAFAATGAVESNLLKNGLSTETSVLHFLYYAYNKSADPLGLCSGDYNYVAGRDKTMLTSGGNNRMATFILARWLGPAPESAAPFSEAYYMLGADYPGFCATELDTAHLKNAIWLDADSADDRDEIKRCLMEYGAASVSMWKEDRGFSVIQNDPDHNGEIVCKYKLTDNLGTNHDVTLIGWDDSFSKANFGDANLGDNIPQNDGAWLFRNSLSMSGQYYFWMSYEEPTLGLAVFYDMDVSKAYDHNYQYDGSATDIYMYVQNALRAEQANVFTSQQDETLRAVGFFVPENKNVEYTIKIYKNPTEYPAGDSDTPVSVKSGRTTNCGYYTVELDTPVELEAGDVFSVVVDMTSTTKDEVCVALDKNSNYSGEIYFVGDVEEGQSYLKQYNEYQPLWRVARDKDSNICNVRVKAFTTEDKARVTGLSAEYDKDAGTARLEWDALEGAGEYEIWLFGEGGEAFVKQESTALTEYSHTPEAGAGSKVYYKVRAVLGEDVYSEFSATVCIRKAAQISVQTFSAYSSSITLERFASEQLEVTVNSSASDKTLTYVSDTPSVATVSRTGLVTAVSEGTAVITAYPRSPADQHTSMSIDITVTPPPSDGRPYQFLNARLIGMDGEALDAIPESGDFKYSLTLRHNSGTGGAPLVAAYGADGRMLKVYRPELAPAIGETKTASIVVSLATRPAALKAFVLSPAGVPLAAEK